MLVVARLPLAAAGFEGDGPEAVAPVVSLRKAAVPEFLRRGEASGSVFEVMAHLSHSDPKTAAIYTKRVDRARLAERAALRAEAAAAERSLPRPENRGTLNDATSRKTTENVDK